MKTQVVRFLPGQDLKKELLTLVKENNIEAGFVMTCVGSFTKAVLRMAGAQMTKTYEGKFEIVSLVGTLSQDGLHLHVSLSDEAGSVVGGHLMEGCMVNSTAEVIIGVLPDIKFARELDGVTGYKELNILQVHK